MTKVSRREFIRDGVAAFTVSFAAPAFLSDIARRAGYFLHPRRCWAARAG